ncbi:hypothetical protein BY458DRAFT_583018 [Sporodiniella umbellata]|nr:hypothetical protein BY458DRAFT_583018 [Sporodiniella umbellata]
MDKSTTTKKSRNDVHSHLNRLVEYVTGNKASSLLPQTQQQQQQQQKRWLRLLLLFYIVFSILLTSAHCTHWLFRSFSQTQNTFRIERTQDADLASSPLTTMSTGLRFSKLFSKGNYQDLKQMVPFWQSARRTTVSAHEVTLLTAVSLDSWPDLVSLAESYEGFISATLFVSKEQEAEALVKIQKEYQAKPFLHQNVDIHLLPIRSQAVSVLIPWSVQRNLARMYARTQYVSDVTPNTILPTQLMASVKRYEDKLKAGDLLVVPTFEYPPQPTLMPTTKKEALDLLHQGKLNWIDLDLNQGPTDLEQWKTAKSLYTVTNYTIDYEPMVIQSKTVQPWCSERFVDKKAACLLSSYLGGNDFLVLPNDFAIRKPSVRPQTVSELDRVVEKRLYAKFYWEECVYRARELDALGLWDTSKSAHIREQCSRVIQNWGRGLVGKPE